jgi:hypothetical protein
MKRYENRSGCGGITGYKPLSDGIILEFNYDDEYLYEYSKPGKEHVERMKILAEQGEGLTTYVNQHVRGNYKKKLNKKASHF